MGRKRSGEIIRNIVWIIAISIAFPIIGFGQINQINDNTRQVGISFDNNMAIGPIISYRGFKNSYLEVGATFVGVGHGITGFDFTYLNNLRDENVSGFSITWFKGFAFFETGLNGTLFTDFSTAGVYLKPYLGLGIGGLITLSYGYNVGLGSSPIRSFINRHELNLIGRFPIGI